MQTFAICPEKIKGIIVGTNKIQLTLSYLSQNYENSLDVVSSDKNFAKKSSLRKINIKGSITGNIWKNSKREKLIVKL